MKKLLFLTVVNALAVLVLAAGAFGATKTWNLATGGTWTTAGNWLPSGAPATGDSVVIGAASSNITAVPTISLGALTITGTCDLEAATSGNTVTITSTLTVNSGVTISMGGTTRLNMTLASTGTGNVAGTMNISQGTANRLITDAGNMTLTSTGLISGSGGFSVSAGATLQIGNASGITATGATGNVQCTHRTYSTTANYVYVGNATQVTGAGLTAANNLTISNSSATTSLSGNVTVSGSLNVTSNTFSNVDIRSRVTGPEPLRLQPELSLSPAAQRRPFRPSGLIPLHRPARLPSRVRAHSQ